MPSSSIESPRNPLPWDADLYLRFEAERALPVHDLIAKIEGEPRNVFDLGCGPGTSTRLLVERYRDAEVTGVDSSADMIARAQRHLPAVSFRLADISEWRPERPADLIFADSALQWLEAHETLFPQLMDRLAPGGVLAVQMPDNRQEPSHALMRLIAADGPWSDRLVPVAKTRAVIATYADYYRWLRPLSQTIEIWQTTYVHPVDGIDAIVDWFRGSALRPFLTPLGPKEREEFLARYASELSEAYEVEPDGRALFLYPRLFVVARKGPVA